MILIAESGSTKTNWLTEKKDLFETIGLNPLFHSTESIYNEIIKNAELIKAAPNFTKVFFYGASCSSPERRKVVSDALVKIFTNATVIEVEHDLKAAAVATFEGETSIACILGTGSNSCLYDGKTIYEEIPSLGYVLGDEGSGAYFGRKLLSGYLYKEVPEGTAKILKEKYQLEKEKIFESIYKKTHPNVYLASFAKVMSESPDKEYMEQLAEEGFVDFFSHHVRCYDNYQQYPVHFVGSIAFHFKDALQRAADKFGSRLGVVDRNPVYRLLDWHVKNS